MSAPPISFSHVQYLSDRGTVYKLKQDINHASAVGNQSAETKLPPMPRTLKPRHVEATNLFNGTQIEVAIGSVTNALWRTQNTFYLYGDAYRITYRRQEKNEYGSGGPA